MSCLRARVQPCPGRGTFVRWLHRAAAPTVQCRADKTAEYNKVMNEKMQWDPNAPFQYDFQRGLYYHHILRDELLCGSQPTSADDVQYLKEAEDVDVIISVRLPLSHWSHLRAVPHQPELRSQHTLPSIAPASPAVQRHLPRLS